MKLLQQAIIHVLGLIAGAVRPRNEPAQAKPQSPIGLDAFAQEPR
jgi:hypothetical protein